MYMLHSSVTNNHSGPNKCPIVLRRSVSTSLHPCIQYSGYAQLTFLKGIRYGPVNSIIRPTTPYTILVLPIIIPMRFLSIHPNLPSDSFAKYQENKNWR